MNIRIKWVVRGKRDWHFKIVHLAPKLVREPGNEDWVITLQDTDLQIVLCPGFTPVCTSSVLHIRNTPNYSEYVYNAGTQKQRAKLLKRLVAFNQKDSNNTLDESDVVGDW